MNKNNFTWKFNFSILIICCLSSGLLNAQNLIYGQTYKLENTYKNTGTYLEVTERGCQDNYFCVATTKLKKHKKRTTSDWVILSASDKKIGDIVVEGDMILLKNPYKSGSYLATRGFSKNYKLPGYRCVSTSKKIEEKSKTTTWKIIGDVKSDGIIQLVNQWNNSIGGVLNTRGKHANGGYKVSTTNDHSIIKQSSSKWRLFTFKEELKGKSTLMAGESLKAGELLISENGKYMLKVQKVDGHLCLYKLSNGRQGRRLWGTMKYGFKNGKLVLQKDGHLVVLDGNNKGKWLSKTHPKFNSKFKDPRNKPVKLVLDNDGILKLYAVSNEVVWSSK